MKIASIPPSFPLSTIDSSISDAFRDRVNSNTIHSKADPELSESHFL
jgi:hypothetical protein